MANVTEPQRKPSRPFNQAENFSNRFEIIRELGKGAAGEVHLAHDTFSQRDVALKFARLSAFNNPEEGLRNRKMWLNETRLAGKLQHPFIVQIYEAGNTDEFDYLVMEYVSGGTLHPFTSFDNLLPLDRLIDILYKICNALDYANKMGVLHRDIKPANVLLGENNAVKVSDFGAAFCTESEVTQVFNVGTLAYMPPEHFRKRPPSLQTDIYAVGVMAYQLLTGSLPFTAESHESLIFQKLCGDDEEMVPLERRRQNIPPQLCAAVNRAMHRDTEVRYDSWREFCDDLAAALPHVDRPEEVQFDSSRFDILRNLAFFSDFLDTEVWETVGICRWQERGSGEALVQEGDAGTSFFIITSGEAAVLKKGAEVARMNTGDCFGEMVYIDETQVARSATVTAITPINVIEIEGESLRHASAGLQARFARTFMIIMVSRLKNSDRKLLSMMGVGWQGVEKRSRRRSANIAASLNQVI
jgi:CRP-like cAMP-binding protein/tRNA A-37 threonylcarbamoyl transferase component Bud32